MSDNTAAGLTPRQRDVLEFIKQYFAANRCSPIYQEITDTLKLPGKKQAHEAVTQLEERGYVRTLPGRWRSISIVQPAPTQGGSNGAMAETPVLEPPFARGPLTVERVTNGAARSVLPLPFVRMTLSDGMQVHLTERQAARLGRQLLAACIPLAPDRLPCTYPPSSPRRAEEKETGTRRA